MVLQWIFFLAVNLPAEAKEINFEKAQLTMGKINISVQIARSDEQHEHGLMFRKSLPANEGMLFVF
ncbi:MAG: DUF192 domain-containing protein, partial [Proteobacteria bacterium]